MQEIGIKAAESKAEMEVALIFVRAHGCKPRLFRLQAVKVAYKWTHHAIRAPKVAEERDDEWIFPRVKVHE